MRRRTATLQDLAHAPMRRGAPLGSGGAGTTCVVTLRRNQGIEERYALKEFSGDQTRETLVRELAALSKLKHPGIAVLHDYVPAGTLLEDGTPLAHPALLFELVEGVTLRELINNVPDRRLPVDHVIEIALALADACSFAHTYVVHRDISASNVMVTVAGSVKLLDFGVASLLRAPGEPRTKTICGTPAYMSPEQASGERPVDQRSDLFAVGVLLYELLSGVRPFDGHTDHETMYRAERGIRVPLSERAPHTPPALLAIVDQLLQRDPDDRFDSARALFTALDAIAPARATRYALAAIATQVRNNLRPTVHAVTPHDVPTVHAPQTPAPGADAESAPTSEIRLRRHRRPLLALAAAALVAGVVGALSSPWARTTARKMPLETSRDAATAAAPSQAAFATAEAVQVVPSGLPAPSIEPPAAAAPTKEPARAVGEARREARATVTIGVRPNVSQVWLDGQPLGWSPQRDLRVAPGKHVAATGDSAPEITETFEVKAGERRAVILRH